MKCSTENTNDESHDERSNGSESAWPGTSMLDSTDPQNSSLRDLLLVLAGILIGTGVAVATILILLN